MDLEGDNYDGQNFYLSARNKYFVDDKKVALLQVFENTMNDLKDKIGKNDISQLPSFCAGFHWNFALIHWLKFEDFDIEIINHSLLRFGQIRTFMNALENTLEKQGVSKFNYNTYQHTGEVLDIQHTCFLS